MNTTVAEHDFSHDIIGAAIDVQRELGVGLLETVYAAALEIELTDRKLKFVRDASVNAWYKDKELGMAFRADFIVEDTTILQVKAFEASDAMTEQHRAYMLSFLRLADLKLGLVLNFHAAPIATKGISRLFNKY